MSASSVMETITVTITVILTVTRTILSEIHVENYNYD